MVEAAVVIVVAGAVMVAVPVAEVSHGGSCHGGGCDSDLFKNFLNPQ